MGCDIHFYVEERRNGVWVSADVWSPCEYEKGRMTLKNELYGDRNYNLFAILANVRNGYGFAGVPTGSGFVPIAEPKGLPDDVSPEVKAESDRWNGDGHSHTWLTVREILDYDWNQKTMLSGVVDAENWRRWKAYGKPTEYSGGCWGKDIRNVSESEMEGLVESLKGSPELENLRTTVHWARYYHECMGSFATAVFRALHKCAPEDVRFVFWFDN